jgi:hypothetical protein
MPTDDREIRSMAVFSESNLADPSASIVDPAWLQTCPSDIQAVYGYWKSKAAGRRMPARADIEPFDLVPFLPSIMLVDVFPGPERIDTTGSRRWHYVYRLVGTLEVAVRGMDPTGRSVATHAFGQFADLALKNYDTVVEAAAPLLDRSEEFSPDHSLADLDAIFLPLSDDGQNVNMVLVYTVQERFEPHLKPLLGSGT